MKQYGILDVSIYHIQLFLVLAKECNFSQAADQMHLTQPALSKRISSLEEMVGVELFDRSKRPVELTPAGTELYNLLQPLVTKLEASLSSIQKEYNKTNRLSVGIPDSGRQLQFFYSAGKALEAEIKNLTFSLHYVPIGKWHEMLYTGRLDIMMMLRMEEPYLEGSLRWERVMEVPKLVCMLKTNPLSQKDKIVYDDLRSQRFVMIPPKIFPTYYRFVREQTMKHGGFEPIIAHFAPNPHGLIASIEHDNEVVICDMYVHDIDSDFVKSYELPDTKSGMDAVWLCDNGNPLIRRYLDLTREYLAEAFPGTVCYL